MEEKATKVVKIHDVRIDQEYTKWLGEIKARYRNAQIKAAVKVNAEQLLFNWELGRDLVMRKAEEKWGAGVVEQISLDLQAAFPESKGFSITNLRRMKQWYSFYSGSVEKLPQLVGELQVSDIKENRNQPRLSENSLSSQLGLMEGTTFPILFAYVPWGHHAEIIAKCKTVLEALFYVIRTVAGGWSRNTLMNCIKANLYHTSGGAITNFTEKLSSPQSELAQAITKDTYDFGFLSLADGYKEEALETELERQLTRFLLELGTGFAYLGRQKQVIVAGKTRKIDMLFFHIPLNCYIVVELKAVAFQPEFAGKLNYYVNIVDDLIRTSAQNPTIGLLICADKDNTDVQYTIKGIQTPIGVASYDNVKLKEIQDQLPTIEELKLRIRLLEEDSDKKN
jgi:predicted nuclease of restriction endonuclease-like (RecB) superfamily